MKQFSQQLYKKAESTVKLQAAEKRELRERLVAYMEYHPLPAEMKLKQTQRGTLPVTNDAFTVVKVPFHALFKYATAVAVFVLAIVPFLAEKAIPGDTLYAIKVQFNEELRSSLTFGSFEKVEWETERLNRRIAEARLLADEGRLTEEVEAEVAAAVREHTENAKREIEVLRVEDADEAAIASIALDTTLEVQATALKGKGEVFTEGVEIALSLQTNNLIADAIDESREVSVENEASSTLPAYEKLMARVEQNTTRIYELRDSLSKVVPPAEIADVTRRAEDLGRTIQEVIALSETDEVTARKSLIEVLQRSQRLIIFMAELEVSKTVDIETLVPVVLTEEEKQAEIVSVTDSLKAQIEQITTMLEGVADAAVREKALVGQAVVLELSTKMTASADDFASFTSLAQEAEAVAKDTIKLLERYHTPVENREEQIVPDPIGGETSSTSESIDGLDTRASSTEEESLETTIDDVVIGEVDN